MFTSGSKKQDGDNKVGAAHQSLHKATGEATDGCLPIAPVTVGPGAPDGARRPVAREKCLCLEQFMARLVKHVHRPLLLVEQLLYTCSFFRVIDWRQNVCAPKR